MVLAFVILRSVLTSFPVFLNVFIVCFCSPGLSDEPLIKVDNPKVRNGRRARYKGAGYWERTRFSCFLSPMLMDQARVGVVLGFSGCFEF